MSTSRTRGAGRARVPLLVAAIAERWGVESLLGAPYNVVWAEVRVRC